MKQTIKMLNYNLMDHHLVEQGFIENMMAFNLAPLPIKCNSIPEIKLEQTVIN
jgi:hypothetical protein